MNKKFFGRVKFVAQLVLTLGILATIPILYFSAVEYKPINFIYAVAAILGTVVLYCILKGIALIGLKAYGDEVIPDTEYEKEWAESLGLNNESKNSPSKSPAKHED